VAKTPDDNSRRLEMLEKTFVGGSAHVRLVAGPHTNRLACAFTVDIARDLVPLCERATNLNISHQLRCYRKTGDV
jgi:hypothetical protein